jgi:hypothetical protein
VEVFSFGNGDFLFQIFSAVKGLMGDGSFSTLIRISVLFGFLIVIYQLFFSMNMTTIGLGIIKQYIIVVILFYALFVPKADVVIRDEIHNTNVSVTQVPLGVSLFAHFFSSIEKGITEIMETYFSTPNDMKFSNSGYAFSVIVLDNMKAATPVDPYFKRTLNDYVVNCFFHDVLWGDKDLNTIIYSNTLLADMSPAHSASLYTKNYNSTYPQGQAVTCNTAYSTIQGTIGTAASNSLTKLNQTMQLDVTARLPTVVQALLNVSQSATDLLGQSFAANAMKTGLAETAMYTGVSADAVAYASALAEQQQRSSWTVAGELSKKYIPIMRQVLEAFVYGLFPILFILMMSPFATKMLHMYFVLLVWLLLWSPLFAIINLIVNTRATGVLSSSYGYYSLGTMPYIYQSTNDLTAMAGYLAWMVPILSFAIAKGSDYAMVSIASSIQGSTNLTTHHAGQGVSGVEGASKSAIAAGHFAAAQSFGSRSVADAVAAGNFFNMTYGLGMDQLGYHGMAQTGRVETAQRGGASSGVNKVGSPSQIAEKEAIMKATGTQARFEELQSFADKNFKGDTPEHRMQAAQQFSERAGYGNIEGLKNAMDKTHFSDVAAFTSFTSQVGNLQNYHDKNRYNTAMENIAKTYFGGDRNAAYGAVASYHAGQIEGKINTLMEKGYDPKTAGELKGHIDSLREVGEMRGLGIIGDSGVISTTSGSMIDKASYYAMMGQAAANDPRYLNIEGELDDKGLYNFMADHHGSQIRYAAEGGITTATMTHGGNTVMTKQEGVFDSSNPEHRALMQELKGQFKNAFVASGQNFSVTRGADGKISTAHLQKGADSQYLDYSDSKKGSHEWSGRLKEAFNFVMSKSGYLAESYATTVHRGAMKVADPSDPSGIKRMWVQGEVYTYRDPQTHQNKIIGGSYVNGFNNSVITTFIGNDGKEHTAIAEGKLDNKGRWIAGDLRETSDLKLAIGGYAVTQTSQGVPGSSQPLYETARTGQYVSEEHKFVADHIKEYKASVGGAVFGANQDLKDVNMAQRGVIVGAEAIDKATGYGTRMFMLGGRVGETIKSTPKGNPNQLTLPFEK